MTSTLNSRRGNGDKFQAWPVGRQPGQDIFARDEAGLGGAEEEDDGPAEIGLRDDGLRLLPGGVGRHAHHEGGAEGVVGGFDFVEEGEGGGAVPAVEIEAGGETQIGEEGALGAEGGYAEFGPGVLRPGYQV